MSRPHASARCGSDRTRLHDEIAGELIAELEAGRVPWGSSAPKAILAMPSDPATGRRECARLGPTAPVLCDVASRDGLQALAVKLGTAASKPGITAAEDVATRSSELAASRYGSCVRLGSDWNEEPGVEHFEAARLTLRRRTGSPVRPALRAIAVARPLSMAPRTLDRALSAALAPAGLCAWAAGPDGAALCRREDIDPALLDRHTPAVLGRSSAG